MAEKSGKPTEEQLKAALEGQDCADLNLPRMSDEVITCGGKPDWLAAKMLHRLCQYCVIRPREVPVVTNN